MRPWVLTQRDVEVHQFLQLMKQERGDADSTSSGEGSNTDSGRGPSEEGDRDHSHAGTKDPVRDHPLQQHQEPQQHYHLHTVQQAQQAQQHGPNGAHGHAQGHGTLGRGITSRPPTRATESYNGGHTPSSTGHSTLPHPPPPPMHTFSSGTTTLSGGPGPHGSGTSPTPPTHAVTTPTKRVTIAPHALIDPPGKTGSLVRAVPARIVGGGGSGNIEHGGPHRTYGYLPARGDPLQQRDPYLSGGYSSGGDRGYHTLNPRGSGGHVVGNPHQVYPCDRNNHNRSTSASAVDHVAAAHARLVHQNSDTTHGGTVGSGGGGGHLVHHTLHHQHHTLPNPPHRASSLPHQPLSSASQGSQGSQGTDTTPSDSSQQSGYALAQLQESGQEISNDVVV